LPRKKEPSMQRFWVLVMALALVYGFATPKKALACPM
jgi:hypothetical protein